MDLSEAGSLKRIAEHIQILKECERIEAEAWRKQKAEWQKKVEASTQFNVSLRWLHNNIFGNTFEEFVVEDYSTMLDIVEIYRKQGFDMELKYISVDLDGVEVKRINFKYAN